MDSEKMPIISFRIRSDIKEALKSWRRPIGAACPLY